MFKKRKEHQYELALQDLTQLQLLQQILLTLERMEMLLRSIDDKVGASSVDLEKVADVIATGINRNTEMLADISLIPESEPKV